MRIPDDEDDNERVGATVPTSPTDSLLSPCSNRILRKNTIGGGGLSRRMSKMSFVLNIEKEKPPTDRELVLGTSSKSRQKIVSLLG